MKGNIEEARNIIKSFRSVLYHDIGPAKKNEILQVLKGTSFAWLDAQDEQFHKKIDETKETLEKDDIGRYKHVCPEREHLTEELNQELQADVCKYLIKECSVEQIGQFLMYIKDEVYQHYATDLEKKAHEAKEADDRINKLKGILK